MPIIPLKKPVEVNGVKYEAIDFDPSVDALEAYEEAIQGGKPETAAVKILLAYDDDVPMEVVGKVRMSAIITAMKGLESPFAASPSSQDGAPAQP